MLCGFKKNIQAIEKITIEGCPVYYNLLNNYLK